MCVLYIHLGTDRLSLMYPMLQTRVVIEDKQYEVYQSIMRENDRLKNGALPDAKLSTNLVDFGDARFLIPIERTICIDNIGFVCDNYPSSCIHIAIICLL